MTTDVPGRISRDDIESKLRELQGEAEAVEEEARSYALLAVGGIAVLVVVIAFLLGSRRGRKHRAIVEIRRV